MKLTQKLLIFSVILSLSIAASGCKVVEDGTVGLRKSLGKISEETLNPGLKLAIPVLYDVEVWNVKTQRRAVPIETPSAEGLMVTLEATVLFSAENAWKLRTTVGPEWTQQILLPGVKRAFRGVIGKKRVEDIIRSQDQLIVDAKAKLIEDLGGRGVEIQEVLVTELNLPEKFRQAVELKLQSEQMALQKEFELKQAKKDAEIEIARAQGAAKAQEIVQRTLSPNYLQYLWISTLNKNPNVIYVATEANMPVFRTMTDPKKMPILTQQDNR